MTNIFIKMTFLTTLVCSILYIIDNIANISKFVKGLYNCVYFSACL